MKKLDMQKLTTVESDVVISKYQGEYAKLLDQNIRLSSTVDKLTAIIQMAFVNNPDAFPKNFVIEEGNNGTDNK